MVGFTDNIAFNDAPVIDSNAVIATANASIYYTDSNNFLSAYGVANFTTASSTLRFEGAFLCDPPGTFPTKTFSITDSSGNTFIFSLNGNYTEADDISVTSAGNTFSSTAPMPITVTRIGGLCFCPGMKLATDSGEVVVEELAVGSMVVTASGARRPVVWVGSTTVDCASRRRPEDSWPIRIRPGAFGEGQPARDLYLSPNHAVAVTCLSEVLIPIKHLINGATIVQEQRDTVSYWHIELETHDLLLAENLPAESFLDTQGRQFFDQMEGGNVVIEDRKSIGDTCRPLVTEGPIIDAVRLQLLSRAASLGWTTTEEADVHILADGQVIRPAVVGPRLRFAVPAATRSLELLSRTFVPRESDVATLDDRCLGVPIRRLTIDDGLTGKRDIAAERLAAFDGFHPIQEWEDDRWLWTNGKANLPPELWADCAGLFILDIEQATGRGTMRAWCEPVPEAVVVDMAGARAARLVDRRT